MRECFVFDEDDSAGTALLASRKNARRSQHAGRQAAVDIGRERVFAKAKLLQIVLSYLRRRGRKRGGRHVEEPTRRPRTTNIGYASIIATISSDLGSTITISSPIKKYSKPRHAGSISTMVGGRATN